MIRKLLIKTTRYLLLGYDVDLMEGPILGKLVNSRLLELDFYLTRLQKCFEINGLLLSKGIIRNART
jgi:hypothetical protein